MSVLKEADRLSLSSLSLSLLSIGSYNFPVEYAARTTLDVLKKYVEKREGSMRLLRLVSANRGIFSTIKEEFGKIRGGLVK